jgi:hypothetical protein
MLFNEGQQPFDFYMKAKMFITGGRFSVIIYPHFVHHIFYRLKMDQRSYIENPTFMLGPDSQNMRSDFYGFVNELRHQLGDENPIVGMLTKVSFAEPADSIWLRFWGSFHPDHVHALNQVFGRGDGGAQEEVLFPAGVTKKEAYLRTQEMIKALEQEGISFTWSVKPHKKGVDPSFPKTRMFSFPNFFQQQRFQNWLKKESLDLELEALTSKDKLEALEKKVQAEPADVPGLLLLGFVSDAVPTP